MEKKFDSKDAKSISQQRFHRRFLKDVNTRVDDNFICLFLNFDMLPKIQLQENSSTKPQIGKPVWSAVASDWLFKLLSSGTNSTFALFSFFFLSFNYSFNRRGSGRRRRKNIFFPVEKNYFGFMMNVCLASAADFAKNETFTVKAFCTLSPQCNVM